MSTITNQCDVPGGIDERLGDFAAAAQFAATEAKSAAALSAQHQAEQHMKLAIYSAMVDRFLGWKLPQDFGPDCGISFTPFHPNGTARFEPVGTNLLTADQALEMFKHCVDVPADDGVDWRSRYMRDVEGLNNEGDPIGGDPAMGLRQTADQQRAIIEDLAQRLRTADIVILSLIQKAGGSVEITGEDCDKVFGHVVENEVAEDKSTFTFRAVAVPVPQVQ